MVLVSLGNWQVRRLAWKEGLIAEATNRPKEEPLDLTAGGFEQIGDPSLFLKDAEYRSATLAGEYVPAGEVLAFTSIDEPKGRFAGPGYWVMTPFRPASSERIVYINRGFVPQDQGTAYDPPPSGNVTLRGLIRAPESGSYFTPDPDIPNRVFYARDLRRIAVATSAGEEAGFFVDLDSSETPPSGLPQAGETRLTFPNNHLQYAVTWYGLAAVLLAVFGVFVRRRLLERGDDGA